MGKLATSSESNGKGSKTILYKKKGKSAHKKVTKKTPFDKSLVEKTSKVYTKEQKSSKLAKSRSSSANKGHKQLEDSDSDMEKDEDMRDNENSSDDESEESGSENMQDGSDNDDNDVESDAAQDDNEDDDDDDDDDDAPTDIEEPEMEDRGKPFCAKKRPRSDSGKKKLPDSKRKNYVEPEPISSKVDGINLSRKKQEELFRPCKWDVNERVKTAEVNFSKWLESHSHREQYFIGDDGVSKTVQNQLSVFLFKKLFCTVLPNSTSTLIQPP